MAVEPASFVLCGYEHGGLVRSKVRFPSRITSGQATGDLLSHILFRKRLIGPATVGRITLSRLEGSLRFKAMLL